MFENYGDLVHTILNDLQSRGFREIQAENLASEGYSGTDGYFQISTQRWYHPDVQARSDGRLLIYEVETEPSLEQPESRERMEVLANAAVKANGQFFLVVPEELRDSAQRLLAELHIDRAEVWGISELGKT